MSRRRNKQLTDPDFGQLCREYLIYYRKTRQGGHTQIQTIGRILKALGRHLKASHTRLPDMDIEHVDRFLSVFNRPYARTTQRLYRSYLRCFLRYLYCERDLLSRDLAELVIGPPMFAKAKPPKFLRPHEIRQLFDRLPHSTNAELRTYAMVHLAFFMGLRPSEISRLTLDDIHFAEGQLVLEDRKNTHPLQLPIPESALKAVTAYIVGARPDSEWRNLFLLLTQPYKPMSPGLVGGYLTGALRSAGLNGTAYWLRHTYAQNLLESGAELFEIRQMLGHDSVESSGKYLSIHVNLMRKVLFDETL
jgi:site-specific recombinase XerD